MRRLFSITLLLLLTLPLFVSFASQDAERKLPACCRRGGAHQCLMGMDSSSGPAVRRRCDSFPHALSLATQIQDWAFDISGLKLSVIVAQPAPMASLQLHAQHAFSDSRWMRGPPSKLSLPFGAICLMAACSFAALRGSEARELTIVS